MPGETWKNRLADLPVRLRFFNSVRSTNDEALSWAAEGAEEYSLIVADHQSAGRGRMQRKWITQPGSALAFSLILHPNVKEVEKITLFSPLAALALCKTMRNVPGGNKCRCQVKWPNDVLLNGKKTAGILVESSWQGNQVQHIILGMGVNITSEAVPQDIQLLFPATSIEGETGQPADRIDVIHGIIEEIIRLRKIMLQEQFILLYEEMLAFKGRKVQIDVVGQQKVFGSLAGIYPNGDLKLMQEDGSLIPVSAGDVHLRPEQR